MNTMLIRGQYGRAAITALLLAFGTAQVLAHQGSPPVSQVQAAAPLATGDSARAQGGEMTAIYSRARRDSMRLARRPSAAHTTYDQEAP